MLETSINLTYSAAPTTDKATDRPIPNVHHIYGEVFVKNLNENQTLCLGSFCANNSIRWEITDIK